MSSDEDYLFDEDDVDSGNESPEQSDDEEDWGMDIGLGKYKHKLVLWNLIDTEIIIRNNIPASYFLFSFIIGDEQGPSGSIEGHSRGGRSGDAGGRGDPDDYYYEVRWYLWRW